MNLPAEVQPYVQLRAADNVFEQVQALLAVSRSGSLLCNSLTRNREGLNRAQAAVRAEKMTTAWNLERSHRYHTLLEGQPTTLQTAVLPTAKPGHHPARVSKTD